MSWNSRGYAKMDFQGEGSMQKNAKKGKFQEGSLKNRLEIQTSKRIDVLNIMGIIFFWKSPMGCFHRSISIA